MWKHFDLNDRACKAQRRSTVTVKGGLPKVFSSKTGCHLEWESAALERESPCMSAVRQLVMYVGVFVGVLFSTAVNHFRTGSVDITITLGEVVASSVVALVVIPIVYEKLNPNPKAPFIVQFGLFVQHGVFWHVLIDSIGNAL